jgi:hypothetical protein
MRLFKKVFMLFFTSYYSSAIPPKFSLKPIITISAPMLILPVPNYAIANSSLIHLPLTILTLTLRNLYEINKRTKKQTREKLLGAETAATFWLDVFNDQ